MTTISEKIKALKGEKAQLGNLEKEKPTKGTHGGARKGGGRKTKIETLVVRGLADILEQHVNEQVDVQITDPKTGKTVIVKKPRLLRVMEALYNIGIGDKSHEALSKWLDRALGKPLQPIGGDDTKPIRLLIDF